MHKNKLYTVITVIVLAMLAVMPAAAGMTGTGVSGINIQNLSLTDQALVTVELWNQDGSTPIAISATGGDPVEKQSAKNYYLPNFTGVPDGAYAMVVSADKPIAAIARTDWASTGGAALYSSVDPGTDVTLPLILGSYAGQTSQFSIQNTDTAADATDVEITLNGRGLNTAVTSLTNQTIAKGTSRTYNLADTAVWGTLPNTGTGTGADGFIGSIRIVSSHNLVVQSFIDLAGSRGVTGFVGVPTASASTTLYCPLIRANYYGDTGISIVNPNGADTTATITFYADAGSPHTGTFNQDLAVGANSSAVAFQGPGGNSRSAPTNLPGGTQGGSNPTPTNDGFYGVAKISTPAGSPVMAVVNDTKFGTGWSVQSQSTYNCVPDSGAGATFALPLVRKYHLSSTKLTTGIQVQNTSNAQVTVSLSLFNWDGTSQAASNPSSITIPAFGSGNFWNGNLTGLPTVPASAGGFGWYGSAILSATGGNIVVVVSDEGYGSTAVDSANYNALLMP
jgi:hypothetical protein